MKTAGEKTEILLCLNALLWKFKASDHQKLTELGIFELLSKGDGSDLSFVRYFMGAWKTNVATPWDNEYTVDKLHLGRSLQFAQEYLQR